MSRWQRLRQPSSTETQSCFCVGALTGPDNRCVQILHANTYISTVQYSAVANEPKPRQLGACICQQVVNKQGGAIGTFEGQVLKRKLRQKRTRHTHTHTRIDHTGQLHAARQVLLHVRHLGRKRTHAIRSMQIKDPQNILPVRHTEHTSHVVEQYTHGIAMRHMFLCVAHPMLVSCSCVSLCTLSFGPLEHTSILSVHSTTCISEAVVHSHTHAYTRAGEQAACKPSHALTGLVIA